MILRIFYHLRRRHNMDFIDLNAQYILLKEKIDIGIRNVLDHGRYNMGPEVNILEELLSKNTNSFFSGFLKKNLHFKHKAKNVLIFLKIVKLKIL